MRKAIIAIIIVAALVVSGYLYLGRDGADQGNVYRFVTVEAGDLESVVAATGNLSAVTTVQVGTQVSGIVNEIYVDFNDRVRKGQTIARIDTTLLVSAIRDAQANLDRSLAQLRQAERERERVTDLFEKQFVAETEYNTALYNYEVADAQVKSSRISLDRARQNLSYATIDSPISGVVIERNVDVGQTVAASLSAPQLFLIANDLAEMQILASVDESDIGQIEEGQTARFTVQAYPDEYFSGIVRQVRMQSTSTENVVNYTVVVDVSNPDGLLLPGMTAVVDFLIDRAENVLMVPNAALRFRPTASMMESVRSRVEQERQRRADSAGAEETPRPADGAPTTRPTAGSGEFSSPGGVGGFGGQSDTIMLWYLDDAGQVQMAPAKTGISDGTSTEITADGIESGMEIIAGVTEAADDGSFNPFQNSNNDRRRFGAF